MARAMELALSAILLGAGCGQAQGDDPESSGETGVAIGIPDPSTGLSFQALEAGGEIVLGTFGQGGTHATLAVQCWGFGDNAFVDITLRNLEGAGESASRTSDQPVPLSCEKLADKHVCTRMPVFVTTNGLDPDRLGLEGRHIEVTATVRSTKRAMSSQTLDAYLVKR